MAWAEAPAARQRPGKVAIMRAAVAVIGEVGYDAASVRDMAARAGVSVAALYYHFPSKSDLLREFLDEAWEVSLARMERNLRAVDDDPRAQLDELVGTIIAGQIHDDFAKLASNVALRDYTHLDPPARAAIAKKHKRVRAMLVKVLVVGVDKGAFTTTEPEVTARAILTLANFLAKSLAAEGRTKDEVIALVQAMAQSLASPSVVDRAGSAAAAGDGVARDRRRAR
jgi:AcrR family transcriptional regulator